MKIEEQLKKATAESEYWFHRCVNAEECSSRLTVALDAADKGMHEFRADCLRYERRLELIKDIQRALQKTGAPLPSWLIGGVTEEKLKELLKEASDYEKPFSFNPVTFHFDRPRGVKVPRALESYILNLEASIRELVGIVRKEDKK